MESLGSRKSGEESNEVATELIMVTFNLTMSTTGGVGGACTDTSSSGGRKSGPFEEDAGRAEEKSYSGNILERRGIAFTMTDSLSGKCTLGACLDS